MRGWKTFLLLFTLMAAPCLCLSVSAYNGATVGVEPEAQSIVVGDSFSVEIWVRQLPAIINSLGVDIEWDPAMVRYVGQTLHVPNAQWAAVVDFSQADSGLLVLSAWNTTETDFQSDFNWLTIDFECVRAGYSEIIISDNVWLDAGGFTHSFVSLNGSVLQIGNQVGGEVLTIDALALLVPWIAAAGAAAAATALVVAGRRAFKY